MRWPTGGQDVYRDGESATQALADLSTVVYSGVVQELTDRVQSELRSATMNGVALAVVVLFGLALSATDHTRHGQPHEPRGGRIQLHFPPVATTTGSSCPERTKPVRCSWPWTRCRPSRRLKEEELNAAATVSGRIRAALDNASSAMLVADAKMEIIYVNHMFESLVRELEQDLRKDLPRISASSLVGSPVDVLFQDPSPT